jgi:glycerophosphoryl diester phosphodiesterase
MRILAHRGLWTASAERNTLEAFERSFDAGFGAEIDVRDESGRLVVSHDPARAGALPLPEVLEQHRRLGPHLPLAFNIKSCGLAGALAAVIDEFAVASYFVFDMAVPDALDYVRRGMPAFTRASEHETVPAFYPLAAGVWLDCFEGDWIDEDAVRTQLRAGKDVALVSPELHGRPRAEVWTRWAAMPRPALDNLYLCTDHPEAAAALFGGPERP